MDKPGRLHLVSPRRQSGPSVDIDRVECPRCGRQVARVIGRSEVAPVVYLRCDLCQLTSIARA
jgi:hypothetical protein